MRGLQVNIAPDDSRISAEKFYRILESVPAEDLEVLWCGCRGYEQFSHFERFYRPEIYGTYQTAEEDAFGRQILKFYSKGSV